MDRENFQMPPDGELTKLTKPGFVSFVSQPPESIEKISWLERLKTLQPGATSTHPATGAPCPDPMDELGVADKPALADTLATVHDDRELCPYRIALDGHAQFVWLEAGLSSAEVVERARALYGTERVADPGVAPSGGWPKLSDISELPPSDGPPLPNALCVCGGRHYWLSPDGWRCSGCHPMPGAFLGATCVVSTGRQEPATARMSTTDRTTLEALHPATVAGIPLAVVLDQTDAEDYADLVDREVLEAFARSLLATGTVRLQDLTAPETATGHAERPLVCCGDCRHFQPDPLGDGSGIGCCAVSAWRQGQPALYPRALRRCATFAAKETLA